MTYIGEYGKLVEATNWYDAEQVQDMRELGSGTIFKYQQLQDYLKKMHAPKECKDFHEKLILGVGEFIESIKMMDEYAKDVSSIDSFNSSTAHYVVATNTLKDVMLNSIYNEIK
jgi:hypothetical protein